jgi:thioredoxin-related protein
MKKSILILFVSFLTLSFQNAVNTEVSELNWQQDYDAALKVAKEQNKPLLVLFTGSDWCGPCKMLERDFFSSAEFKSVADEQLILYKADFPRRKDLVTPEQKAKNGKIKAKFGVRGYPTVVVVDGNGEVKDRMVGYSPSFGTENHYKMLDRVLK